MTPKYKELADQCYTTHTTYFDGRGNVTESYFDKEKFAVLVAAAQPAQRPWVGLTGDERESVLDSVPPDNMGGEYYDKEITAIAFAIEAKLKEKNT